MSSSVTWGTTELTDEQRLIRTEIRNICEDFDAEYWREHEANTEYPHEFAETLAEHGWLGVLIPEEYGGAGMGTSEQIMMMEEIAASGAGLGGAQAIHGAVYTSTPLVKYGSEDLKESVLPELAAGKKTMQSMALTEPNAGSESTAIETRAERDGDEFIVNGQKVWTSRVDVTDYLMLVARTTPRDEVDRKTEGITLFLVDLEDARDQDAITMESINKTAFNLSHSFEVWLKDLRVPADNVIGAVDEGFYQLLDGLNEERLVIAAECIGHSRLAVEAGVAYAGDREVFERPIGKNQAIQHPLAEAYMQTQAAKHLTYHAAAQGVDRDKKEMGVLANTAKYLSARAAYDAADAAVQTHGGFGVAREYDVERYFRDARLGRIAPVTQELALNYVAETALGLPRSY
jgi:acyl-CoA dehydrogenase